jgi:hypothetical protein
MNLFVCLFQVFSTFLDSYHRPKAGFLRIITYTTERCVKLFRWILTKKTLAEERPEWRLNEPFMTKIKEDFLICGNSLERFGRHLAG